MSQFTSILLPEDFKTGEYRITQNTFSKDDFKIYISDVQEETLKQLLGIDLYLAFGAELPTPTLQKYIDLLNGVVYIHENKKVDYTGLKRMLKAFTFNAYVNDQDVQNTIIGNVSGVSRNSENLTPNATLTYSEEKNNKGVNYYREAQLFIERENNQKRTSTAVTDNLDNTYTVAVADTTYIVAGNSFELNGVEYVFDSVVDGVSFNFTALTGLNFPNESIILYNIFAIFSGKPKNKSFFGGMIS